MTKATPPPKPIERYLTARRVEAFRREWATGRDSTEVVRELGVPPDLVAVLVPVFEERCRVTTAERFANPSRPEHVPLTTEWRARLLSIVSTGTSVTDACGILGLPVPTVVGRWLRDDPTLREEVQWASARRDVDVKDALFRRAIGYDYPATEIRSGRVSRVLPGAVGGDGGGAPARTVDEESSSEVTKTVHVPGDVVAQKMYLVNRCGWTAEGRKEQDPLDPSAGYDLSKLTEDEVGQLTRLLNKAAGDVEVLDK